MVGLVWFFPLKEIANEFIAAIDFKDSRLEFQDFDISSLGNIEIEGLKFSSPASNPELSQGNQDHYFKIPFVEGEISLFDLLFLDTINSRFSANTFELNLSSDHSLSFKGSDITLIMEGQGLESDSKNDLENLDILLQLNAVNILGIYDSILPFIGEKLGEFTISNMVTEVKIKRGILHFKNFHIESSLGTVQISGSLPASLTGGQGNLTITINPAPLLQKYSKFNLEYNLKNTLQILHDDGRLIYICRNSLGNCQFQQTQSLE